MLLNLLLTLMHHGLSLYIDHTHFTVSATGTINDDDDDDDKAMVRQSTCISLNTSLQFYIPHWPCSCIADGSVLSQI